MFSTILKAYHRNLGGSRWFLCWSRHGDHNAAEPQPESSFFAPTNCIGAQNDVIPSAARNLLFLAVSEHNRGKSPGFSC